jgi:predicted outer membrane lipoprotein
VPSIFGLLLAGLFGFLIALILKKPSELELLVEKRAANLSDNEIKFKFIFN